MRRRMPSVQPTKTSSRQLSPGCLRLFFLPFGLVGAGIFFLLTVRPALQVLAARAWAPTPCVVEASTVRALRGSKGGTSYRVETRYRYEFAGREYFSERYGFSEMASSGRASKARVVASLPPGTQTTCYVNPARPHEAVIERRFDPQMAVGAFGLMFFFVGALGIVFAKRLTQRRSDPLASPAAEPGDFTGAPVVLAPAYTPVAKFLGILIFAILWNGILGAVAWFMFSADAVQKPPFFARAIVGVLLLFGVGMIGAVIYHLLALFNPRVQLTAAAARVPLGGELAFTWQVRGRAARLRKLRVSLEGREEATFRHGKNRTIEKRVFADIAAFETTDRDLIIQGSARVILPPGLMHTFKAHNNKIVWRLRVHGEVPHWPDVANEYPIHVAPLPHTR